MCSGWRGAGFPPNCLLSQDPRTSAVSEDVLVSASGRMVQGEMLRTGPGRPGAGALTSVSSRVLHCKMGTTLPGPQAPTLRVTSLPPHNNPARRASSATSFCRRGACAEGGPEEQTQGSTPGRPASGTGLRPPTQQSLIVTGASAWSADGRAVSGGEKFPSQCSPPNAPAPQPRTGWERTGERDRWQNALASSSLLISFVKIIYLSIYFHQKAPGAAEM